MGKKSLQAMAHELQNHVLHQYNKKIPILIMRFIAAGCLYQKIEVLPRLRQRIPRSGQMGQSLPPHKQCITHKQDQQSTAR